MTVPAFTSDLGHRPSASTLRKTADRAPLGGAATAEACCPASRRSPAPCAGAPRAWPPTPFGWRAGSAQEGWQPPERLATPPSPGAEGCIAARGEPGRAQLAQLSCGPSVEGAPFVHPSSGSSKQHVQRPGFPATPVLKNHAFEDGGYACPDFQNWMLRPCKSGVSKPGFSKA